MPLLIDRCKACPFPIVPLASVDRNVAAVAAPNALLVS